MDFGGKRAPKYLNEQGDDDKDDPDDHLMNSSSTTEYPVRLEDVYKRAGGFGRYQWILLAAAMVISYSTADVTNINIIGAFQDHWCYVDQLQNYSHTSQKEIAIPYEGKSREYEKCGVYDVDYSSYSSNDFQSWNRSLEVINASTHKCRKWVFDKSVFESTIRSRVC